MTTTSKILLGLGGTLLAVLIISAITTASVIGIKALYEHTNPTPVANAAFTENFQIDSVIEDVPGFTSRVEEYTKQISK